MNILHCRKWFAGIVAASAIAAGAAPVLAAGAAKAPAEDIDEDEIPGEAFIAMKLEFVKFTVDGKEWDNHEYINGNKTLVIRGIGRDDEHTVVLLPRDGNHEPYTLTLAKPDFKRTIVKAKGSTRFVAFRANAKVDFAKVAAPAPEKPADRPAADKPAADKPAADKPAADKAK